MSRYLIMFCFIAIVPLIKSAEVQQKLRRMIDESITPGELHEDQLEERIKSWAGLRTMDGVRALYDIFENARLTKNSDDILACSLIQKKPKYCLTEWRKSVRVTHSNKRKSGQPPPACAENSDPVTAPR